MSEPATFIDHEGVTRVKHCFRVRSGRECQEPLHHDGPCIYKVRMLRVAKQPGQKSGPTHVPSRSFDRELNMLADAIRQEQRE